MTIKEHCYNCQHVEIFDDITASKSNNFPGEIEGVCEYWAEEIVDLENETCFDWALADTPNDEE